MKKTAIIIMTLALLFSVSACNKSTNETTGTKENEAVTELQTNADGSVIEQNYSQQNDAKNKTNGKSNESVANGDTSKGQSEENSSNSGESSTAMSNPIGSGIELPEIEV